LIKSEFVSAVAFLNAALADKADLGGSEKVSVRLIRENPLDPPNPRSKKS
jgi:hypothetical protein